MKHRLRLPIAVVLLLALVACSTTRPPDRVALSTLETIRATSESVMRVHASLWAKGLSSADRRAKVDAAYDALGLSLNAAAVGLSAVKTWVDMARLLEEPEKKLGELKALVPEFKGDGR